MQKRRHAFDEEAHAGAEQHQARQGPFENVPHVDADPLVDENPERRKNIRRHGHDDERHRQAGRLGKALHQAFHFRRVTVGRGLRRFDRMCAEAGARHRLFQRIDRNRAGEIGDIAHVRSRD